MAFTGEIEQLHIVDIIQLLNTTRKSGIFSVKGIKGESRIIFSNGYIVGASHLNNKIRIGAVLVKMNAIGKEDLAHALHVQKSAGKNRKPLITTLIELGKLDRDAASRGLKKLIVMTLVDLIGWSKGTFTLDTDIITVSSECSYPLSRMEQEISIDAQVILMDALRIFDEQERDRQAGKPVPLDEEAFVDESASDVPLEEGPGRSVLTAGDLGLSNLDLLERKIPLYIPTSETFDPLQIHRQKIKEILADFPSEEQESFISFLEKSTIRIEAPVRPQRQEGMARALLLFSEDELIKHSVMTICKDEGVLVFATDGEEELNRIIEQCLTINILPLLVFDSPSSAESLFSSEKIVSLRQQTGGRYPQLSVIQMASLPDYPFMLQSLRHGIRSVFPKPSKGMEKSAFISDTILFLEAFKSYITFFFREQKDLASAEIGIRNLRNRLLSLRKITEPSAIPLALLQSVSELCERSITFIVRPEGLTGEKAIGVFAAKHSGAVAATKLKIPLTSSSVLREVIEKGEFFSGEVEDNVLKKYLFEEIGAPLKPTIFLLPMKSRGKTVTLTYGDYGGKEASFLHRDILEILALEAGLVLDNSLYRKQLNKMSYKQ